MTTTERQGSANETETETETREGGVMMAHLGRNNGDTAPKFQDAPHSEHREPPRRTTGILLRFSTTQQATALGDHGEAIFHGYCV